MNTNTRTSKHRPLAGTLVAFTMLSATALSLAACDSEDVDLSHEQLAVEPGEELTELELEILADLDVEPGPGVEEIAVIERRASSYYFIDTGAGIGIGEIAPTDADGILDRFQDVDATALEIYAALGGVLSEAPAALVADHTAELDARPPVGDAQMLQIDGASEVRDLRSIVTQSEAAALDVTTGPLKAHVADNYSATCSFSADGQTYFDGLWMSYGWTYHWYNYSTSDANTSLYSGTTGYTPQFRGHTCNNGSPNGEDYEMIVYRWHCPTLSDYSSLWHPTITDGYRAVYYQTSTTEECTHRLRLLHDWQSADIQRSLGIMAP